MNITEDTMQKAEAMQKEMHEVIKWMIEENPDLSYQDCVTVYVLLKLQELNDALTHQNNNNSFTFRPRHSSR
jgi:hypothetical protein